MGKIKAAFMFVVPDADPERDRMVISTPEVLELTVVGVKDYKEAARVARKLAEEGVKAIELCAGFGQIGVARVAEAVGSKAAVGAVRFDRHPLLDFKSGDDLLAK